MTGVPESAGPGGGAPAAGPTTGAGDAGSRASKSGGAAAGMPSASDAPPVSWFKLTSGADGLDWALMVVGTLGALGNGVALPLFSLFFGDFTNAFGTYLPPCLGFPPLPGLLTTEEFRRVIAGICYKFLYLAAGAAVAGALQQGAWNFTSTRQSNRLRQRYLAAVLRQDVGFFDTQATTGGLLQGLNEDSLAVQAAVSDKTGQFLQHSATFLAGYCLAFAKGWDITLVLLGCMPFLAAMGAVLAKLAASGNTQAQQAYTEAGAVVQQSIAQIRTVAAYNGEAAARAKYDGLLDAPQRIGVRMGFTNGAALGGMQFAMFGSYALALWYGANRVTAGRYTGGEVISVIIASIIGSFSLGLAGPLLQQFSKGMSAGGRMFAIMARRPAIDADAAGERPAGVRGEIELRGVSFAYPARPDALVFSDFNLRVPPGKTVALVGSSGSGKSTVVGLIERYYDPLAGAVTFDGVDLRRLNLAWLRQQVGLVSQEPTLFQTTIRENIALGKPGATVEEIEAAAAAANAARFIANLPLGLDTQVGERGVQLSGGQKQRIAIARAILKNPKVLLLDEATSALDVESERVVQAALDALVVGRTTVVVAHRLSTIKGADVIAVVKQGKVVEQGTHEELLRDAAGHYSTLVKLQLQASEVADSLEAELEEARESGPVSRASLDKVHSRRRSLELVRLGSSQRSSSDPDAAPPAAQQARAGAAPPSRLSAERAGVGAGPRAAPGASGVVELTAARAAAAGGECLDGGGASAAGELRSVVVHALPHSAEGSDGSPNAAAASAAAPGGKPAPRRRWGLRCGAGGAATAEGAAPAAAAGAAPGSAAGGGSKGAAPVKVPFSRLVALNKPEAPWAVLGCAASVVCGGIQPAFAFVFVSLTVAFYKPAPEVMAAASFYAWMFFVIACGILAASLLQQGAFAVMGQALARRVRVMLFGAILRQDIAFFDEEANSSGRLSTLLSTDAAYIRGAVGDVFGATVQNLAVLVVGYAIAFVYNWRMALVVTGAAPFIALGGLLNLKYTIGATTTSDKAYASANQAVTEAVGAIRVVHAYNLQGYVADSYGRLLVGVNRLARRTSLVGGASVGYAMFSMFAVYALITFFGGEEVVSCRSDFDSFFKAFMCVLFAAMGLSQVQMGFPDLAKAQAAVQRVFPIIDRTPVIDSAAAGGLRPGGVRGEVELRGVAFAYPSRPSVMVFSGFNLRVPAGKTVALVGESGSGKSTVVGLIERYYDPLAGAVFLDGTDIRQLNLAWLRQQIGLVSQEPLLFAGSVLENITYGTPGATREQVEAAAAAANAADFIGALPEGYETKVGERGVQLSGGQKQRIAIARAIVKAPKVLLLDEATSALDAASEAQVQAALDAAAAGRTTIVVAHRLSTVRNADAIAVVYRGVILEQGTHEELMAIPNGGYARLAANQSRPAAGA